MRIDISDFPNVAVKSFELRLLNGTDSMAAAERAFGPKTQANSLVLQTAHKNQMIADAITMVNDQPVIQPFNAWVDWDLRTQEFVVTAFDRLHGMTIDENRRFLARIDQGGSIQVAETSGSTGSASGPGQPGI